MAGTATTPARGLPEWLWGHGEALRAPASSSAGRNRPAFTETFLRNALCEPCVRVRDLPGLGTGTTAVSTQGARPKAVAVLVLILVTLQPLFTLCRQRLPRRLRAALLSWGLKLLCRL